MAETTIGTYLGWADIPAQASTAITEYTKYVDITDYSDLESAPETIDVTTMSNHKRVYKQGLPDQPQQTYTAMYDPKTYAIIKALGNTTKAFCLMFEESNSLVKWTGQISVQIAGGSIAEVRTMTITVVAEDEIEVDGTGTGAAFTPTKWYFHADTNKINKTELAA